MTEALLARLHRPSATGFLHQSSELSDFVDHSSCRATREKNGRQSSVKDDASMFM